MHSIVCYYHHLNPLVSLEYEVCHKNDIFIMAYTVGLRKGKCMCLHKKDKNENMHARHMDNLVLYMKMYPKRTKCNLIMS